MLYNVHKLRRDHTEVEVFARFLEEAFDPDDLLFFLYVRSVVQKELSYNFRGRWSEMGRYAAPTPGGGAGAAAASPASAAAAGAVDARGGGASYPGSLQMSFRDCSLVSRVVFGSESDPLFKTFIAMIERNMVGKKTAKADNRRIDVSSFLHLAVVEYHETRPAEEGGGGAGSPAQSGGGGSGGGGDAESRLFREAAAAYDARSAAAAGSAAAGPRPSPALLEALGECMHRSNEAYLDRAVGGPGAQALPREVQSQIRVEVQLQLESKVDAVLAAVITLTQGGTSAASAGAEVEALAAKFSKLVQGGGDEASVSAFCAAVLASSDVTKTITPLVNLLVEYAASKLKDAAK